VRKETLIKLVATNLRRLRTKAGLSQEQLADKAGLHRTYIGNIERGEYNVTLGTLAKLSTVLGVHPCELISDSDARR
jgi:transcriptional regulator with XRE-family HTH domain